MKKNDQLLGLALVAVALAAFSDPRCQGGCRTWAEHVLNHGIALL